MDPIYHFAESDQTIILCHNSLDSTMGETQRFSRGETMHLSRQCTTEAVLIYVESEAIRSTTHRYRMGTALF
jgi:hypothetical protein